MFLRVYVLMVSVLCLYSSNGYMFIVFNVMCVYDMCVVFVLVLIDGSVFSVFGCVSVYLYVCVLLCLL